MNVLDKLQTVIILVAVGVGLFLGQVDFIAHVAESFIIPCLFLLLYSLFLAIPLPQLKKAFLNMKFLSTNTMINFIWTPVLAWGLGSVFLANYPALWIGFIMLMVTPCTDWYIAFTSIAKGNVALSTSILPLNFILQVVLLPIYLFLFARTVETIPIAALAESISLVVIFPLGLAILTRFLLRNKPTITQKIVPFFSTAQIICLSLAIMAMFASRGTLLLENLKMVFILVIPMVLFFMINFMLGRFVGRLLKFSYADSVSLTMTIVARNSPVALAIAVTAFPDQPLIALTLVVGPLIELPALAIVTQRLLSIRKRAEKHASQTS